MPAAESPARGPVRQLGLFTVLCIGVNNIVGSGIYRKPSELAGHLGPASWIAFAIDGLLLVTVALCYAAMSSRHGEAGGPYIYARKAFGPWIGFVVAWTAWISMWAAMAGAATAVPGYLAVFVPGADSRGMTAVIALAIVVGFGLLNCRGVKPAAGAATALTVAKLLPLLLFVGLGLAWVSWDRVDVVPRDFAGKGGGVSVALGGALFAAFYPLQGFEVVPVPAAELRNPRRDVPLAVTISLLASAALYCLIQIVAVGTCPEIASVKSGGADVRPLAAAASTFMGASGEKLMAAGACVSMLGFAAVTIFCAPRFLVALGDDGLLPASFARHSRAGTPVVAILVTTGAALFGALFTLVPDIGERAFNTLTNLSNLAVLVQYVATCIAVMKLRAHVPAGPHGFRLLGGRFVIPGLGLLVSVFLLYLVGKSEDRKEQITVFLGWVIAGLVLAYFAQRARARARRAGTPG